MTLEVVSFTVGAILIATAIVGGGFEIREIRMPRVGIAARIGALVVGSVFVLMGVGIWGTTQPRFATPETAGMPLRSAQMMPQGGPAPSRQAPAEQPAGEPAARQAPAVRQPSAAAPAPRGITGRAHLSWNVYGSPYEAVIETSGQTGVVRVAFVGQSGSAEQVDQDLVLEQGAGFLFYRGSNPRYAGTGTPHPTYSPDGFRLVEMQSGVWSITETCDEQGVCAPVRTKPLP